MTDSIARSSHRIAPALIAKAALQIEWTDTESAARRVAETAADMINDEKDLYHAAIKQSRHWKAQAGGAQSALQIVRISEHCARRERFAVERELATVRGELEDLRIWFARARSQGCDVPRALTDRMLNDWRYVK
jgi:hypothetical protein